MAQQPLYRRGRSTRLLVVGLVTASLITITIDYRGGDTGPLAVAGRTTLSIISPLQRAMSNVLRPVGDFFSTLTNLGSLRAENERLQGELSGLLVDRGTEFSLLLENRRLKRLLQLREAIGGRTVSGRVIAIGVANLDWTLTINVGSTDGLQVNDPVVGPDGLVGHVVRVTRDSAQVQQLIAPGAQIGVKLPLSDGEIGLLTGQGDRDLRMELVDPLVEVSTQEPVVTAGLVIQGTGDRSIYPPNVPIGVVSRVQPDEAALEQVVEVRPNTDFTALDLIFVLID